MTQAFQIHPDDNVAVLLEDAAAGEVQVLGVQPLRTLRALSAIKLGHKIAVRDCAVGQAIVKYGVRIGHALMPIRVGDWVHLHNLGSDLDERSGTFDGETGAPSDTKYE